MVIKQMMNYVIQQTQVIDGEHTDVVMIVHH